MGRIQVSYLLRVGLGRILTLQDAKRTTSG
jgi:hypothetical protein